MYILGISAYYHDSAACLLKNGVIVSAAQEERFTRNKGDKDFPVNAIQFCLKNSSIQLGDVEHVVFYEKPFLKFERLIETYLAFAPKGFQSFRTSMPLWIKDKLFQKFNIISELTQLSSGVNWEDRLLFSEHHLSHAASAFYPSPFKDSAVMTIDGVGEWATTSLSLGTGNSIERLAEQNFPHSLGLLYSTFTSYLGFRVNSGEYKLMGLAPYGEPIYVKKILDQLIDLNEDGSFKLNMEYFGFATSLQMFTNKFDALFNVKRIEDAEYFTEAQANLASSIQRVTELVILKTAKHLSKISGQRNLCYAGGVALNCVANGLLEKEAIFEQIWVQPSAGDAGGALGAALAAWHIHLGKPRNHTSKYDQMNGSYLGPSFSNQEIREFLDSVDADYQYLNRKELITLTAKSLSENKAIGWMQGRMEFGPRALGNRSILANPKSPKMQMQLNLKIKKRESFRPFAPSVLDEEAGNWFAEPGTSPYMLKTVPVNARELKKIDKQEKFDVRKMLAAQRSSIPAVTHIDNSARVQTVSSRNNELFHSLLTEFKKLTGCPILVNTSFNVRGEPIVCNPNDAWHCFMHTDLDILVLGQFYIEKKLQVGAKKGEAKKFKLD